MAVETIPLTEETKMGSMLTPTGNIRLSIATKLIKDKTDRSYNYRVSNDIIPVFLVGDSSEADIPMFRIPLVITTGGVTKVVSNMSGAVKQDISKGLLESKRTDYVDFELVRTLLLCNTISSSKGRSVNRTSSHTIVAKLATQWVSNQMKSILRVDDITFMYLELAVFIYFVRKYVVGVTTDEIADKITGVIRSSLTSSYAAVVEVVKKTNVLDSKSNISDYVKLICNEHKTLKNIDESTIMSLITNNWYSGSDSSNLQIMLGVEDYHTMAGIMYHAFTTQTGKKSLLGRMLVSTKKYNDIEILITNTNNILKDYKL